MRAIVLLTSVWIFNNDCYLYADRARADAKNWNDAAATAHEIIFALSALSLFMALVLGANDHDLAVSFDDFAFVAHRFY